MMLEMAREVSIHAPVMDANFITLDGLRISSFNPRARDGREEALKPVFDGYMFQSTRP